MLNEVWQRQHVRKLFITRQVSSPAKLRLCQDTVIAGSRIVQLMAESL